MRCACLRTQTHEGRRRRAVRVLVMYARMLALIGFVCFDRGARADRTSECNTVAGAGACLAVEHVSGEIYERATEDAAAVAVCRSS